MKTRERLRNIGKRLLASAMALSMCLSLVPDVSVYAADDSASYTVTLGDADGGQVEFYSSESGTTENLNDFVWKNRYFDESLEAFVYFGDLELKDQPKYNYYLFYDAGCNHAFHNPIEEADLAKYPNLPVREISGLITTGHDIADLLANQFVLKVISVIESGEYIFE